MPENPPQIIAIIVAAGSSSRMGSGLPKPYRMLDGKPLLRRAVDAFASHPMIDAVVVAVRDEAQHIELFDKYIAETGARAVAGGDTRQQSVYNALQSLSAPHPHWVLVHDAARPWISADVISRICEALQTGAEGAIPVVPVVDTVKEIAEGMVVRTLPRASLAAAQTPQGFRYAELLNAYVQAGDLSHFTDDASIAEAAGMKVLVIEGEAENRKVTFPEDLSEAA